MYWLNTELLRNSDEPLSQNQTISKPAQRWGQSCVSAYNKLYIIGGYEGAYLGDVWEFDFANLAFSEMLLEGPEKNSLSRSNHTAIFYPNHNSIYVFGGGQAQKQRFNDTIKLEFENPFNQKKGTQQKLIVSKLQISENSPLPSARTYHASCLLGKYMVVVGGEANSDLKDFWALDLEERVWYKPDTNFVDYYTPKRFHTVCAINDHQVVTFGGCHSEYVHMNEMHIFELSDFLQNPKDNEIRINCNKVNITQGVPSTRWGHAASTYNGKLYILGGRNEQDVIDLHEFDPEKMRWREIDISGPLPKPRRRHSALFVSGSLIMFGGFDGNFFNDLNILDFQSSKKQIITIQPSTINQDYLSLVNSQENSDITFILDNPQRTKIYAHKPLVLFRLIYRELMLENLEDQKLNALMTVDTSKFIKSVYLAKFREEVFLQGVNCRDVFLKFLEFIYCDRLVNQVSTSVVRKISDICKTLGLTQTHILLKKKADFARMKIQQNIQKDLNAQQNNNEQMQLNRQQQQLVKQKVEYLENTIKIDFAHIEDIHIQSPEDKQERLHNKALNHMNQCKNLDDFYDILFLVQDTLIKANSLVLSARCPYFKSMLSNKYNFQESKVDKNGYIRVNGVPKLYFSCIIQYIYSDHFYISKQDADFFIKLLIYADYFMLPRLIDICSSYLKQYVNVKSALQLLLLAHAHNADQLEKYCQNFIAQNEKEIMETRYYRSFKRQAQDSLYQNFLQGLIKEKEESYVQICINNYLQKKNNQDPASKDSNDTKKNTSRYSQVSGSMSQNSAASRGRPFSKQQDEDIDIDELLNQSQYIYLEEHQRYESYDQKKLQASEASSIYNNQQSAVMQTQSLFYDEEMKNDSFLSFDENNEIYKQTNLVVPLEQKDYYTYLSNLDKENHHPTSKVLSSKKKALAQQTSFGKTGLKDQHINSKKSRDSKRQPLRQVQDSVDEDDSDGIYGDENVNPNIQQFHQIMINASQKANANTKNSEITQAMNEHQQQQQNHCNFFQMNQ